MTAKLSPTKWNQAVGNTSTVAGKVAKTTKVPANQQKLN